MNWITLLRNSQRITSIFDSELKIDSLTAYSVRVSMDRGWVEVDVRTSQKPLSPPRIWRPDLSSTSITFKAQAVSRISMSSTNVGEPFGIKLGKVGDSIELASISNGYKFSITCVDIGVSDLHQF